MKISCLPLRVKSFKSWGILPGDEYRSTSFPRGIKVQQFRSLFRPRIGRSPHAVVCGVHVDASHRAQVVEVLVHEVRHATGQGKPNDLLAMHASHVKERIRGIQRQAVWEEVFRRYGERNMRLVHWQITAAGLRKQVSEL